MNYIINEGKQMQFHFGVNLTLKDIFITSEKYLKYSLKPLYLVIVFLISVISKPKSLKYNRIQTKSLKINKQRRISIHEWIVDTFYDYSTKFFDSSSDKQRQNSETIKVI